MLYWIFHSPYKVGVVSMELSAGQYANALFSRYVGKKLSLMDTPALSAYLNSDEAKEKANELFKLENGSDRFFLIEDRSSKLQIIQDLIIQLIIGCGCKMIIIDPIQDLIGSLPLEQQENHMSWQKVLVKAYNVCIVNVSHTRKAGDTKSSGSLGAIPSEEAMSGSSSIIKSGSVNILLARNKMAEDELERNTIKVFLSKSRQTGITGPAGHIYYDVPTHTLHDESAYRAMYPEKFVEDEGEAPDESISP